MPKQPLFESAKHQFLLHANRIAETERVLNPDNFDFWNRWIGSLTFELQKESTILIKWKKPTEGQMAVSISGYRFYSQNKVKFKLRRDVNRQIQNIVDHNVHISQYLVRKSAFKAGLRTHRENTIRAVSDGRFHKSFHEEERLFDSWALTEDPATIDVIKANESVTAPEMRFITRNLGNLQGKKLLDIGCGLGEASVYFAGRGAKVTAVDLSEQMLSVTRRLAKRYGVHVDTYRAAVEHLHMNHIIKFDIVYAGNVFHHIDIDAALTELKKVIHKDSVLVSWDPVGYNPILKVYRNIATKVRSFDERPIRLSDIDHFRHHFNKVSVRWFWLTTLLIFLIMVVWEKRNPNEERLWKSIVREGNRWRYLYRPLEAFDNLIMTLFPFLKPFCWNVVIIAKNPK